MGNFILITTRNENLVCILFWVDCLHFSLLFCSNWYLMFKHVYIYSFFIAKHIDIFRSFSFFFSFFFLCMTRIVIFRFSPTIQWNWLTIVARNGNKPNHWICMDGNDERWTMIEIVSFFRDSCLVWHRSMFSLWHIVTQPV